VDSLPPSSIHYKLAITTHPKVRARIGFFDSLNEIRRSKSDPNVYLFYRSERPGRWICAVVKKRNTDAFLVTTYLTDALKEGEKIWTS